jgi:hypothetical protein
MTKNECFLKLGPAQRSEILEKDWRPWAYSLLGLRAPGTWEVIVRPNEMLAVVPEEIADSYSWKMHQKYLVAVIGDEKALDGEPLWFVKPTSIGNRRGVVVRPSHVWPEEVWDRESLLEVAPSLPKGSGWQSSAVESWEIGRNEGATLALLIELLSAHLSAPLEAQEERRLHLVE